MFYLKLFTSETEKEQCVDRQEYVSFIVETKKMNIHDHYDYSKHYLTFVAKSSGTFKFSGATTANTIQCSTDNGETWSNPSNSITININSGDTVLWKNTSAPTINKGIGTFSASTATFDIEGNAMSMIYGDNYIDQTSLSGKTYAFYTLFKNVKCVNANNLKLPATTLAASAYTSMFEGCTSLTTAPQLPATTLAWSCYRNMFNGCTSLTTAPQLPATTLSERCYQSMFGGCTSLTTAPQLQATTLYNYCYSGMFNGCTMLTTAPSVLPATTLASGCYTRMFGGCTSLTTAPQLSATTLASYCCDYMFGNCTSLTTAPQLQATTLAQSCYTNMFNGCTNLNYIKMLATDISATDCLTNWVNNVAASGTFVKNASMTTLPSGVSGIPNGWTVQDA